MASVSMRGVSGEACDGGDDGGGGGGGCRAKNKHPTQRCGEKHPKTPCRSMEKRAAGTAWP